MDAKQLTLKHDGIAGATLEQVLRHVYCEWLNNYLTVEKFAEHHDLDVTDAKALIALGAKAMKNNDNQTRATA